MHVMLALTFCQILLRNFDCWLCSTELLSLLMRGSAMGNVGAHSEEGLGLGLPCLSLLSGPRVLMQCS